LTIDDVSIDEDGFVHVDYTTADADGRPLDRTGFSTEGAVDTSFILSWLEEDEAGESLQYHAYTLREQTGEASGDTVMQSSTDSGGMTISLEDPGAYRYTLGTLVDTSGQEDKTHTLGVYATRTFGGIRYVENELFSFVPNGDDVETTLDVVTNDACGQCHTTVEAHGGARQGVDMCVLCHTESNSIDPDTGNTFNFEVMIHKIHRGANLPSVEDGEPYQIIGFRQSVHDYSDVHYPGEIQNCGG